MIKILVDAASDYDIHEAEENNIEFVPIGVTMGEEILYDGVNITRDEFFIKLRDSKEFPKTSQPSPQVFVDIFEKVKEKGDEMICLLLSSKLSGTVQSAMLAKNMIGYQNIHIIDSLTATFAIKIMADYGRKLIEQGKTSGEIADAIEAVKSKVKVLAVLDTLENLYKGGRLSKLEAGVGNIAKIKPLITLTEDGKITVKGKSIGRKKACNDIIKLLSEEEIDYTFPVYGIYSYGTENLENFMEQSKEIGIQYTDRLQIGPTIGTHIGEGAYGIVFVQK